MWVIISKKTVIEGSGLLVTDKGKEVYAKIEIVAAENKTIDSSQLPKKMKTKKVKSVENPKWEYSHSIPINQDIRPMVLSVNVFEGRADFIGMVEIPLETVTSKRNITDWFPLQKRKLTDEVRGELHISLDLLVHKDMQTQSVGEVTEGFKMFSFFFGNFSR